VLVGLAAGLFAAVMYGAPSALQAHASRRLPVGSWWRVLLAGVRDPAMLGVFVLYAVGGLGQYVAIQHLPLYLAQAAIATQLLFTALGSSWMLHERPRRVEWLALAAICVGLGLLAISSGNVGDRRPGWSLVAGLLAATLVLGVLGLGALRLRNHPSAVVLGLLSGTMYGLAPLGARVLRSPYLTGENAALGVAMVLLGALAFWLSSVALQRAPVNVSSAPLILTETLVPAVLGLAIFDDSVRGGELWAFALGLALSLAGAVAVPVVAPEMVEP
jgi:drug/metabolite transporter (DMT)-like permease